MLHLVHKITLATPLVESHQVSSPGIFLPAASSLVIKHKQSVIGKTFWIWGAVGLIVRTQGEGEETHIVTVLQNTEHNLNSLAHFVAFCNGSRRERSSSLMGFGSIPRVSADTAAPSVNIIVLCEVISTVKLVIIIVLGQVTLRPKLAN